MTPIQMSYRIWPVVLVESLFFLILGFALLVFSGDKLVEASVRIARRWGLPASVIAATIIAAGTSAPEFVTSFLAGFRGKSDISIGNVIGSNIFNILAVGGLSLTLQSKVSVASTKMSWIVLCLCTLILFFFMQDLLITRPEALLLAVLLVGFIFLSYRKKSGPSDSEEVAAIEPAPLSKSIALFIVSNIGLIAGAEIALRGGIALGEWAGLTERIIAITIISAGTGLPELATSVAAAYRGHGDVAIANVIGSNIFNSLAIPAGTAAFFALNISARFIGFDYWIMALASLALGLLYFANKFMRRTIGVVFVLGYCSYIANLILRDF